MVNSTGLNQRKPSERLLYVENIRISLIILVIVQHLIVGYGGGSGKWYYNDPAQLDGFSWYVMTLVWLLNQSFFMAFFFMLSGYFTPGSYDKKGAKAYLEDRLKRMGVPLGIYILIVNPVLSYVAWRQKASFEGSLWDFLPVYIQTLSGLDVGVLWFLEALLIFSVAYALWRRVEKCWPAQRTLKSTRKVRISDRLSSGPSNIQAGYFGLVLGGLVFADRTLFLQKATLQALGLPQGHFLQYIAYMILGIVAYRRGWFLKLTSTHGKVWAGIAILLLSVLPGILVAAGFPDGKFSPYAAAGDWSWQALLTYTMWEQFVCMAIVISALVWFRRGLNFQNKLAKVMSRSVYAVYVVHTPIVTVIIFALRNVAMEPLIKCTIVTPITIIICFLVGHFVRQLPFAKQIL